MLFSSMANECVVRVYGPDESIMELMCAWHIVLLYGGSILFA